MDLRGVHVPITTPFLDDGALDLPALARNVAALLRAGLSGIVALGTTGEAALLDDDEADRVIAAARRAAPAATLIAGCGRESTRATIAAARRAADLGADALLVRTPASYRARMDDEALAAHYLAVADAARPPLLLYSFSGATGVRVAPPLSARLAAHPRIVGIKESDPDVAQIGELVRLAPPPFQVLAGSATTFLPSLAVGAAGGVLALANLAPHHCLALHAHVVAGRLAPARRLSHALAPLARLASTHGVPGLKAALGGVPGLTGGPPRPPLRAAPPSAAAEILAALAALPPAA